MVCQTRVSAPARCRMGRTRTRWALERRWPIPGSNPERAAGGGESPGPLATAPRSLWPTAAWNR